MRVSAVTAIGAFLLLGRIGLSAQIYSITSLGPGNASAINNAGQILGSDSLGSYLYLNGVKQYLPQPAGGTFSPAGLNNLGVVAGYINPPNQFNFTLATYSGGVFAVTALGGLAPAAINDAGQIVGAEVYTYQGFFYSNGVSTTVGPLPYAINNSGTAAGTTLETNRRAFVYQNGQVSYLAPPGAASAQARAVNDSGEVVGNFSSTTNLLSQIFIYANGQYREPGSALNRTVESDSPAAVNNAGLIVGAAEVASGSLAWSYDPAFGFSDLNSAINTPGWVLQGAADVNDGGQIVGTGLFNGQQTAFLLTPVPEPSEWALLVIGAAALAVKLRNRQLRA